jgi:carboxyl-terminal processing protease
MLKYSQMRAALVLLLLAACTEQSSIKAFPDSYVGVGVELRMNDSGAEVIQILPGGPAGYSGMKSGDVITAIDGTETAGLSLESAVSKLRGPAGSQISIRISRSGENSPLVFILKRGAFKKSQDGEYNAKK